MITMMKMMMKSQEEAEEENNLYKFQCDKIHTGIFFKLDLKTILIRSNENGSKII